MHHTLLPPHLQAQLMDAAATKDSGMVNAAIASVYRQAPANFHTGHTLKTRKFFYQPTSFSLMSTWK